MTAAAGTAACEPARAPSNEPARSVALDVELPSWELSLFNARAFSESLRSDLASHNVRVVDHAPPALSVVVVNLGLYNNRHAIDFAIMRSRHVVFSGRVLVPDRAMTTLDVAAGMVAEQVAAGLTPEVDVDVDPAPPL